MLHVARSLVVVVAVVGAAVAHASDPTANSTASSTAKSKHARVSLISDASSIAPGKPFTVALRFEMDPSWHVYWKDPGDSGMPPSVKWTLPEGFTAGEIQFPKPEVLKTTAGTNYVYHGDVAFLVTITPSGNVAPGASVPIKAQVDWLECDKDACLAADAALSTSVGVASAPVPNQADQFKTWHAKVAEGESFDPAADAKK